MKKFTGVVLLILMSLCLVITSARGDVRKDNSKRSWSDLMKIQQKAMIVLKKEKSASGQLHDQLSAQRKALYHQAAVATKAYMAEYITDHQSVNYIQTLCRLADYYNYAEEEDAAIKTYISCLNYPKPLLLKAEYRNKTVNEYANNYIRRMTVNNGSSGTQTIVD